jgi:hypothetical protein
MGEVVKTCTYCNQEKMKVICLGMPMRLCIQCGDLDGVFSWVIVGLCRIGLMPISYDDGEPAFKFLAYNGSYLSALFTFMRI